MLPNRKVHTVYRVTNALNSRYYFGVHETAIPEDDYLGSGIVIKRAVHKYGKENFKKEVLFCFEIRSEAYDKEIELIAAAKSDPLCYNLQEGGEGGFEYINAHPELRPKSENISAALKKLWQDPVYRENQVQERIRRWTGPDYRAFMSDVSKQMWEQNKPTLKIKIQRAVKDKWADPKHRESHAAANRSPEAKSRQSAGHKKQWENLTPQELEAVKRQRSEMWKDGEVKARMVQSLKNSWTPERKEAQRGVAALANHTRWHVNRGVKKLECKFC